MRKYYLFAVLLASIGITGCETIVDFPDKVCEDVVCPEGYSCTKGVCVDAEGIIAEVCVPECLANQECIGGVCKDKDVTDPPLQECDPACVGNTECKDGVCVPFDPCENVVCNEQETCQNGTCVPTYVDPCKGVTCKAPLSCVDKDGVGTCVYSSDPSLTDSDGDSISDFHEGYNLEAPENSRDSDSDGIPDYLDDDSDSDGIPDKVEAGRPELSEPPLDSNEDGNPDFLEADSDANGIPDSVEAFDENGNLRDTDNDTIPDFSDSDNDNDYAFDIDEIRGIASRTQVDPLGNPLSAGDCNGDTIADDFGSPESPWDCDGDTIPDYLDNDSDDDTILDRIETNVKDTNKDGFMDRYSQDSDGDTILDKDEARLDVNGIPADTDGDGIPDFIDLDSDDDGLSDAIESTRCTSPLLADTDGDGDNDVIEWAAGTDPCNKNENSQTVGNFVFTMPYEGQATPKRRTLSFETAIQTVDIYFSLDQSGTMREEFKLFYRKFPEMIESMRCRDWGRSCSENADCEGLANEKIICSEASRCITSPAVGAGCFANMYTGFGIWGDINSFENQQSLAPNADDFVKAMQKFDAMKCDSCNNAARTCYSFLGCSENMIQPSACIADGTMYCSNSKLINCYPGSGRIGCAGFRPEAIKIVLQAGDEANYNVYGWTVSEAAKGVQPLVDKNIRFIGLYGSPEHKNNGLVQLARAAGSCPTGHCDSVPESELFLAPIAEETLDTDTVNLIRKVAKTKRISVTTSVADIDTNASKLIKELRVNNSGETVQNRICTPGISGIGFPYEGITELTPGTSVCYDVIPVDSNTIFPATDEPQVKKARVFVHGDGSVLNSGIAYFLIPAKYGEILN